ncbi:MAG: hypothetical protein JKY94_15525 [Rhodobacteraceae bacterium]|nr:hypothetical protein [Paracoccaceae bacterium]
MSLTPIASNRWKMRTPMAEALTDIEGAFILSIDDRPEVRELFGTFQFEEVSLKYSVAKSEATIARELIVSNREQRVTLL